MQASKRRLFAIAVSIFVALGISGGLLNIAWTYMQVTFGVKVSAIGVLLVCATTGSLIAAFGSGAVIGRFGIGQVALGGALLMSAGLLGVALAPAWAALVAITFVLYMGRGTLDAGMNNFVSANYDSAAMNWLHASWGVGLTVAPGVATFIIVTLDQSWRVGYAMMAGVALLLAAIVASTRRQWDAPNPAARDGGLPSLRPAAMRETLRQPVALWSIALFFVYGGIELGAGQLVNTLLVESRGVAQEIASLWLSFYWGSFTVGRILIGILALRLNDRAILRVSTIVPIVGTSLLVVRGVEVLNLIGLILIGLGLAAIFPILIAQTPGRIGRAHTANAIGFQVGFASLGAAILPGLYGLATDFFGLEALAYGLLVNAAVLLALHRWVAARYSANRAETPGEQPPQQEPIQTQAADSP